MSLIIALQTNGGIEYDGGVESDRWILSHSDGDSLVIEIEHGECDRFRTIEVQETADAVTLAALYDLAGGDDDCNSVGLSDCYRVTLNRPLGGRTLRHAITSLGASNFGQTAPRANVAATGNCLERRIDGQVAV